MTEELPKYRPERPILLNTENTGFKTKVQVLEAIEKLRAMPHRWLCAWSEKIRPLHFCFNSTKDFAEFKRSCKDLGIKLTEPVIAQSDIEALEVQEKIATDTTEAEAESSIERPDGSIVLE